MVGRARALSRMRRARAAANRWRVAVAESAKRAAKLARSMTRAVDSGALDRLLSEALDKSYHDGEGGWDSTAVRWWLRFHAARGEDATAVAGPERPLQEHLDDEWRLMRFITWLAFEKEEPVQVDTAYGYASTVQGWLARNFGVKLGAGMTLHRVRLLVKGMHRMKGGKPPKRLRKALTPEKLARAMLYLDPDNALHANVRAMLSLMLQCLLRGGEAALNDKVKEWRPQQHLSRADFIVGERAMQITINPEKDEGSLGAKATPVIAGRGGTLVDAVWEFENLRLVDRVSPEREAFTPAFRDPRTGKALRVCDANKWVKELMERIGEDPEEYGSHSLRIGGATAMYKYGASALDIRTVGRWSSDVYLIYVHADRARAAEMSRRLASTQCDLMEDPFLEVDFY